MLNDFGIDTLLTRQSLLEALGPVIPDQDWHEKGQEAPGESDPRDRARGAVLCHIHFRLRWQT